MLGRRAFITGAASGAIALTGARRALAQTSADPVPLGYTRLRVVAGTLTVGDKTGLAYRIQQDDGTLGYTGSKGQRFQVAVENGTTVPLSIHWHGLILANGQDGVPYVTQAPLKPGERRLYDFPLVQAGTYWMHSHFGLEEQPLMTAPLILRDPDAPHPEEHEVVVFLNDFTTRDPAAILAGLQGGGGSGGARGVMTTRMAGRSMPSMARGSSGTKASTPPAGMAMNMPDLTDVKYDAFLANRRSLADPEIVRVLPGRTVRLRIINGASATNFFVRTGRLRGEAIAVDGSAIVPLAGSSFELAISQRVDVRVTIPHGEGVYPVLAQGEGTDMLAGVVLATPGAVVAPIAAKAAQAAGAFRGEQELRLRATQPLPARPVDRRLRVSLGGDMAKYIWTLNGQAWPKITPLEVKRGERVEVSFVNETGMGHPMHLHGHVFQVTEIGGKPVSGARRDSVYVLPRRTIKVQFDAAYPGYWMIHCHVLYHQAAGMQTVMHYEGFTNSSYDPLASMVEFRR
ncbi:MAG TPA: multicopper oxidase family protein [Candidatus Methylomirabilis sp.]|nr:multicopper oxidase family protein [Candidatus Methylomirabilis sp.]